MKIPRLSKKVKAVKDIKKGEVVVMTKDAMVQPAKKSFAFAGSKTHVKDGRLQTFWACPKCGRTVESAESPTECGKCGYGRN